MRWGRRDLPLDAQRRSNGGGPRQLRRGIRVLWRALKLKACFSSTVELCDECSNLLLVSHSQILSTFNFSFPPPKDPPALVCKSLYKGTCFFIFAGLCSDFSQVPHHLVFFFSLNNQHGTCLYRSSPIARFEIHYHALFLRAV